jgi:hypothetical protein
MTTENTEHEQSSAADPQGRNEALVIGDAEVARFIGKLKKYLEDESPDQNEWEAQTVLKDVIYLFGTSVDDKYAFANGFDKFKEEVEKALSL